MISGNLKKLLDDLKIDSNKLNEKNAREILDTIADKWNSIVKDSDLSQTVTFEANCQCPSECCAICEKRWNGECKTTCYTYNFDCDKCSRIFKIE